MSMPVSPDATRHEDSINAEGLGWLVHSHAEHLDADEDYWFRLRGHSMNPLIDAATPLLGMIVRVRNVENVDDLDKLYRQVVDEVSSIEVELTEQGYDRPTLLAYRYSLCAFIDEAIMATPWGSQSAWAGHSLLARFHNETWGGEKVFSILSRLRQEPRQYRDLLTFIYLCLCLGFGGRYKVRSHSKDEYDQMLRELGDQLISLDNLEDERLTQPLNNVQVTSRRQNDGMPLWGIFAIFFGVMLTFYLGLSISLEEQADQVSALLDLITN